MILLAQGNLSEAIVIANASGLAIASRLQQMQSGIWNLVNRYPLASNQCEKLAEGIVNIFRSNKVIPEFLRLTPTSASNIYIGNGNYVTFQHFAVRIGNRVYDTSTGANGILYNQYINILNQANNSPSHYSIETPKSIAEYF